MSIKTIPLSRLEAEPSRTLKECADSGELMVVKLPDERLVAIQPLDPSEDDSLTDDLIAHNAEFRQMLADSKASPRKPFKLSADAPK